jgi:putative colanic acid biosynthesis acetyltransferase WcaF
MINLFNYNLTFIDKTKRFLWVLAWIIFFRLSPSPLFFWRNFLLKLFGAKIGDKVEIYPSTIIWAPWNLEIGACSGIGPHANIYNVAKISIGERVNISQFSFLCTATHDINSGNFQLQIAPIYIEDDVWIAAAAYISFGLRIGNAAVVGAKSCVFKDIEPYSIVGGNPSKIIGIRKRI